MEARQARHLGWLLLASAGALLALAVQLAFGGPTGGQLVARARPQLEPLVRIGHGHVRLVRDATGQNSTSTGTSTGASTSSRSALVVRAKKKKRPQKAAKKKSKSLLERECLDAHNKFRRQHGVPDLEFDAKIASFAQKRADFIAESDGKEFKHPPDLPFGENLFWHSATDTPCELMVRGWYDEIDLYDFEAAKFNLETGHFTQLIWRTTERVGCATATSSGTNGGVYLVCNYDPAGNFLGEFNENVPRALGRRLGQRQDTATPATSASTSASTTTAASAPASSTSRAIATPATTLAPAYSSTAASQPTAAPTGADQPKKPKKNKKKKKNGKPKNKKAKKKKKKKKKPSSSTTTPPTPTTTTSTTTTYSAGTSRKPAP